MAATVKLLGLGMELVFPHNPDCVYPALVHRTYDQPQQSHKDFSHDQPLQ